MDIVEITNIAWEWQIELLLPLIVVILSATYAYRIMNAAGDGLGAFLRKSMKR